MKVSAAFKEIKGAKKASPQSGGQARSLTRSLMVVWEWGGLDLAKKRR